MNTRTKKLTTIGMLCALAYIVMIIGRIPIVLFLKYDPKDVVIAIGGLIYGPLSAVAISAVVSFVEMLTVSDTGPIGLIMNVLSTCSFCCTAAYIYKKKHTMKGAIVGLITGWLVATVVMMLWNYLITPLYMGYPREAVVELLLPAFLPFNLIKGGLNAAITMLLYKPVVNGLRRANLLEMKAAAKKSKVNVGMLLVAGLILISCVLLILVVKDII